MSAARFALRRAFQWAQLADAMPPTEGASVDPHGMRRNSAAVLKKATKPGSSAGLSRSSAMLRGTFSFRWHSEAACPRPGTQARNWTARSAPGWSSPKCANTCKARSICSTGARRGTPKSRKMIDKLRKNGAVGDAAKVGENQRSAMANAGNLMVVFPFARVSTWLRTLTIFARNATSACVSNSSKTSGKSFARMGSSFESSALLSLSNTRSY
mmetsp:Transcript_86713/g.280755  ORF Transcript_86713/g.280755 Transcript_86713/m.280755 type:complete len:213 (+) Transcript_86713:344-982(+)